MPQNAQHTANMHRQKIRNAEYCVVTMGNITTTHTTTNVLTLYDNPIRRNGDFRNQAIVHYSEAGALP